MLLIEFDGCDATIGCLQASHICALQEIGYIDIAVGHRMREQFDAADVVCGASSDRLQ